MQDDEAAVAAPFVQVVDVSRRTELRVGRAVLAAAHADLGDDRGLIALLDALPAGAGLLLLVERIHADGLRNHQQALRVAVCRALRRLESAHAARVADVVVAVAGTEPAVEHVEVPADEQPGEQVDGGAGDDGTRTVRVRLPDRGAAEAATALGRSSRGGWVRDQRALAGPMRRLHTALRRGQVTAAAAGAVVQEVAAGLSLDDVDDERVDEHDGLDHARRAALAEVLAEQAALRVQGRTPWSARRWASEQVAALRADRLARRAAEERSRRRVDAHVGPDGDAELVVRDERGPGRAHRRGRWTWRRGRGGQPRPSRSRTPPHASTPSSTPATCCSRTARRARGRTRGAGRPARVGAGGPEGAGRGGSWCRP